MSTSADRVLDPETRDKLGEPVEEKPANELPSPYNNEIRRYEDDMTTVAGPAYNVAKDLSVEFRRSPGADVDDIDEENLLDWVKQQLTGEHENAVYVNDKLQDVLDVDDKAAAYMRFQGDTTTYPVRLRSRQVLFDRMADRDTIQVDADIRRELAGKLENNHFMVPTLTYTTDDGLVRRAPAVIAYRDGDGLVALEDDETLESYVADEFGNPHDLHAHIESDDEDVPQRITLDLSRFDPDAVEVETIDGGLAVFADDDLVYTNHRWEEAFAAAAELPNGLYEIRPD